MPAFPQNKTFAHFVPPFIFGASNITILARRWILAKRLYIGGTFDCLHSGHLNLFRRAKEFGTVIVAINTDEFAERYKRKPFIPFKERFAVLSELRCVDEVVINEGGEDSKPSILKAKATHIVHGDDWKGDSLLKQMQLTQDWLAEHRIEMFYLPYTQGISTSQILAKQSALDKSE
jgi:glycerol-3-phosphate cytidylyltransferase